jgi:hypothetical protein
LWELALLVSIMLPGTGSRYAPSAPSPRPKDWLYHVGSWRASAQANRGATPRARQASSSSYSGTAARGPRSGLSVYRTS